MVHDTPKFVKRNYLYFLVEEGFRKINASDRLRDYLALKFSQRAEIEMRYIKLLQDWLEELAPPREKDDGSECYMDSELIKRLTTGLQTEARQTIEARQRVYNCIMAEDGPYSRLQSAHMPTSHTQSLSQLRESYSQLDGKRASVEKDHKRYMDAREHLRNKIDDMEGQLSQRSRLVTSRRPPTRSGTRKIDDMRSNLSVLRQQHAEVQGKIEAFEQDLRQMQKSVEQPLNKIDKDLQEIDETRTRTIVKQSKLFLSHLGDLTQRKHAPSDLDIEPELIKGQWAEVQANARRMELGEQFKLRELFEVNTQKPKSQLDSLVTKTLGSKAPASNIRNELANLRNRMVLKSPVPSDDDTHPDRNVKSASERTDSPASSMGRYWPAPASAHTSNSTCSELDRVENMAMYEGPRVRAPSSVRSTGSIEELILPPEVRCPAELSSAEPNKQYAPKVIAARPKTNNPSVQITEFRPVSRYSSEACDDRSSDDEQLELARQRDVRVVAINDNMAAPGSNALPFKKGQVIKQKAGVNEDGFCYGWTRDRPLGRKLYGYYRPCLVRPQSDTL